MRAKAQRARSTAHETGRPARSHADTATNAAWAGLTIGGRRDSPHAAHPSAAGTADAAAAAGVGGTPLASEVRSYFEPRFGRDFGDVRVHADSGAADAARQIQARAYTIGRHLVFASGEYAPSTDGGRRLIAHELTHVVQQRGAAGDAGDHAIARTLRVGSSDAVIQRDVAAPAKLGSTATTLVTAARDAKRDAGMRATTLVWGILHNYFQAESAALWVNVVSFDAATTGLATSQVGSGATSQGRIIVGDPFRDDTSEGTFEQRVADVAHALQTIELWRRGKPVPDSCDPSRPLTWADFTGPVGSYTAYTGFDHTLATVQGEQIIRATFAPSRSYVKAAMKDPSKRSTSGCAGAIASCENAFKSARDITVPLGTSNSCAAGVQPDSSIVATSKAECASVLGPECDRVRQAESERLLRHEQLHFDIACVLARKGTRALALTPSEPARILQAVKDRARALSADNGAYDSETDHSCNADSQAAWESSVGRELPMVVIS